MRRPPPPRHKRLPLRHWALSLLLPLLLLLGQHGAAVHALGHFSQPDKSTGTQQDEAASHGGLCLSCLSFADLDNAAAPAAFSPLLLGMARRWLANAAAAGLGAAQPAARSRGPPPTF